MNPALALATLLALAGCDVFSGPQYDVTRDLGVLAPSQVAAVVAPDTVFVGEAFPVTVTTIGGGCTEADGLDVALQGPTVELRPYDVNRVRRGGACTLLLTYLPRTRIVSFSEPGPGVLRALGRGDGGAETVVVERVFVRER